MESNLNSALGDKDSSSGAESSVQRIYELSTALIVVKEKFSKYRNKLQKQIVIWGLICLLIVGFCALFGQHLLKETFPTNWTWQIGYISIIRITIAGAVFSIASYCFKLLRSYIHLNEHNTHCITVIESMANLVGAAKDEIQRNVIYSKLIDIIIHFGDTGLLAKEDDFKSLTNFSVESLQKIIESKK